VDKAVDNNVARPSGKVIQGALYNDVFPSLKLSLAVWATERGVGEESLAILTSGSVACGHAGKTGAQCVGEAYGRKPGALFGVSGHNNMLFLVLKV